MLFRSQDDWPALARLPWIGTPPDSVHHRLLAPVWDRCGERQNRVAEVDQESSMLDLVAAGIGLSLARESPALRLAHERGLVLLRHRTLDTELSFVSLNDRQDDATIARLHRSARDGWDRAVPMPGSTSFKGPDATPAPGRA